MSSRADLYLAAAEQIVRVEYALAECVGPQNAKHIDQLSSRADVPARKTRSAYAKLDGESFVLGKCASGLYVAETPEQAAALDAELLSKLRSLAERLRRRRAWWKRQQTPTQMELFGAMRESA